MLAIEDLTYAYPAGPTARMALSSVSFTLPRGQIVGLLGENGAGKTTLLNCITGLTRPDRGSVTLDGVAGEGIRSNIAFVSGQGAAFGSMTPAEMGEFLAEFYEGFDRERYKKLLDFFALPNQPITRMSKGQKGRAELAAGFCKGADYILLDEPFSGKDVFTREDFVKIMAGSLREHEAILISTHLIADVEQVIDRALILHEGRLVRDLDMAELQQESRSLMDVLREATGYDGARAARLLAE